MNKLTEATVYAEDKLLNRDDIDLIHPDQAQTLYGLFVERVNRSPDKTAYYQFESDQWREYSWRQMSDLIDQWRSAFIASGLKQ